MHPLFLNRFHRATDVVTNHDANSGKYGNRSQLIAIGFPQIKLNMLFE